MRQGGCHPERRKGSGFLQVSPKLLKHKYFFAGQYKNSWLTLTKFHELGHQGLADLYYRLLLEGDSIEKIIKEPAFENNENMRNVALLAIHLKEGDRPAAEKIVAGLLDQDLVFMYRNYFIALAHAYGDDPGGVTFWLERSLSKKESELTYLGVEPAFKKFINEPGVEKILLELDYPFI
ncbi:MAG: hypothetical protein RQ743_13920 [Bacteroidales bacterium]|nr:hypothetical protein [Bacteroidales bacterium]